MSRKKKRAGRLLKLETMEMDRLDIPTPLRSYPIQVQPGQRVFVFVLSAEERLKMSLMQVEQQAKAVGDMVFPHQAVFLVVQPGATLEVYEVRDPCHPAKHADAHPAAEKAGERPDPH